MLKKIAKGVCVTVYKLTDCKTNPFLEIGLDKASGILGFYSLR